MHPLYQRLKELDPDTFERFCLHLLCERHPGLEIRHVEGCGGDEGIDLFLGDLADRPTIWQCKTFPNGIRHTQKRQIRESLSRAIRTCSPRRWILCINVDLDAGAFRWYQTLQQSYGEELEIGLFQASEIVSQLAHYRTVCDAFFPGARLDVDGLRALVAGTRSTTNEELEQLAMETTDQLLQRLKQRDARFNYEISFSRDIGQRFLGRHPGEVVRLTRGATTIRAIARDVEALRMAPPTIQMIVKGDGIDKLHSFVATGRAQELVPGEIIQFRTTLPMIDALPQWEVASLGLKLSTFHADHGPLPLRVSWGSGPSAVIYDYVPFKVVRAGREEVEIVSAGDFPFLLSIVIRNDGASVCITESDIGAELRSIRKFMDALRALSLTERMELHDLASGKRVLAATVGGLKLPSHWAGGFENLVRFSAGIADALGLTLYCPQAFSSSDYESLRLLKAVAEGTSSTVEEIGLGIVKSADNQDSFVGTLDQGKSDVEAQFSDFEVVLFGKRIPLGTVIVIAKAVPIKERETARRRWLSIGPGEAVDVRFGPAENAVFRRLTHLKDRPAQA